MAKQKKKDTEAKPRFRDAYMASSTMTKVLVLILSIVAIVALAMAVVYIDRKFNPTYPIINDRYAVSIEGEVVCLPREGNDEAHTLECRLGIRDDEGNYLKLDDNAMYDELRVGDIVRVKGIYEEVDEGENEPYDVSGTMHNAQVKTLQSRNTNE